MSQHTTHDPQDPIEEWRDIPGYDGIYQVSDRGRVRSRKRLNGKGEPTESWHILRGYHDRGYIQICLRKDNKQRFIGVHGLVLLAFVGERPPGMGASHLDGIKTNNSLSNLVWETHVANINRKVQHGTLLKGDTHPTRKLTEAQVREIHFLREEKTHREIAALYGVSRRCITAILNGRNWRHVFDEVSVALVEFSPPATASSTPGLAHGAGPLP